MPVSVPTKTDGSIGRVKTDAPGSVLTSLDYQVPAAEWERIKDTIIATAAEVNAVGDPALGGDLDGTASAAEVVAVQGVAIDATAPAAGQVLTATGGASAEWADAGGGGSSPVLWKWNETDATEFTAVMDEIGSGGVVLSRVMGEDGPRLRIAFPTKTNAVNLTVIAINALALPLIGALGDMRRYVFKCRLVGWNTGKTPGEFYSVGLALCCNGVSGAGLYCQVVTTDFAGNADRTGQVDAGLKSLSGSTPGWGGVIDASVSLSSNNNSLCVPFEANITQRHVAAAPPDWRGELAVHVPNSVQNKGYKNCSRKAITATTSGSTTGWAAQDFDTVGLAILGTSGTQTDHYFEFDQLRVETHPMDL